MGKDIGNSFRQSTASNMASNAPRGAEPQMVYSENPMLEPTSTSAAAALQVDTKNNEIKGKTIRSTGVDSANTDKIHCKVTVFGDDATGKSALIHNLQVPQVGKKVFEQSNIFQEIEYPPGVLNWENYPKNKEKFPVYLHIWENWRGRFHETEYDEDGVSNEDEIAYTGSLFTIITVDITNPESANNAFNKYLPIRNKYMPESFLFIIGTHSDCISKRRVDVKQICRAASENDAIYLEISNTQNTNIHILRKLIAHRISYMLIVRENLINNKVMTENDFVLEHYGNHRENAVKSYQQLIDQSVGSEEAGHGESKESPEVIKELNTPFLQSNICADSIGSILASCINTEYWPGFDDAGESLTGIGEDISHLISLISSDPQSLPEFPKEFHLPTGYAAHTLQHTLNEEGIDKNIEHYFDIMGLKLPKPSDVTSNDTVPRPLRSNRRRSTYASHRASLDSLNSDVGQNNIPKSCKLKVHLPGNDDSVAIMTLHSNYDVEQQVDAFLVQYGIEENTHARAKLMEAANNAVESLNKGILPTSPSIASTDKLVSNSVSLEPPKPASLRQFKIKLKLPNSTIDLIVQENEDLSMLARSITASNNLDQEYETRILKQLMKLFI